MALCSVLSKGGSTEYCDTGLLNVVTLGRNRAVVSWKIENVVTAFQEDVLVSPSFHCFGSCRRLNVKKKNKYSSRLDLKLKHSCGEVSNVFLRIYLDYSHREIVGSYNNEKLFLFDATPEQNVATFFETEATGPNYFHPNDFLNFSLEMKLSESNTNPIGRNVLNPASKGAKHLARDILLLLHGRKNCDVNLQADGKQSPAHRLLLGARSRVFEAMFNQDTEEKRSGIVNIKDVSSNTMLRLLCYIYSGDILVYNPKDARDLYLAAEKFEMTELKERCADILLFKLSTKNAFDIAMFGDTHSDKKLVNSVIKYVRKHLQLLTTSDWTDLLKNRPSLASEILLGASFELTGRAGNVSEHRLKEHS